jgi:hypothetical protein
MIYFHWKAAKPLNSEFKKIDIIEYFLTNSIAGTLNFMFIRKNHPIKVKSFYFLRKRNSSTLKLN